MPYTIKRKSEFTPAQWSGGSTTELFIHPEGSSNADRNFELRVSSATVELEESEFSDFSGYERHIAPLAGSMRLEHEGRHSADLRPCETDSFKGEWTTRSFGKCVDFNLIHRPGWNGRIAAFSASSAIPLEGTGFVGVYALRGNTSATIAMNGETARETLQAGDFLLIECGGASAGSCLLETEEPGADCFAIAALAFR